MTDTESKDAGQIRASETKEKSPYRQVYIRFGRGEDVEALTLKPEIVELITEALTGLINKGEMYIAGPDPHRAPKGHEQAETIWTLVRLLKEKAD